MPTQSKNCSDSSSTNDWYYYQNGEVKGPHKLEKILNLNPLGEDHKPTLICRSGLGRWFLFSEIQQQGSLEEDDNPEKSKEEFKKFIAKNIDRLKSKSYSQISNKVESKTIEHSLNIEAPQTKSTLEESSSPSSKQTSSIETFLMRETISKAEESSKKSISQPMQKSHKKKYLNQLLKTRHIYLRGRLRLGEISNPILMSVVYPALTLGLFLAFWFKTKIIELLWHGFNIDNLKEVTPSIWLFLIPIVHNFYIYKIAILLREIEKQNGYQRTVPSLAALLSLIPPLGIYYIQTGMNNHWYLHVEHHDN